MSDTPTPPWGIRVEHDGRNEYADGVERLQTRLLHIGLFLLTVVMLGGGAGVLMAVTEETRATAVSVAVVAGCVVAVLVALAAAMSATRQLTPLARRARPAAGMPPQPQSQPHSQSQPQSHSQSQSQLQPRLVPEPVEVVTRQPEPAPLWARSGEQQITITDDPGQRREVFVKLARRLQSLINRAIKRIDELEQDNEDPVLLDGLYEIDHLFTLARRQGENLAVLGGEAPQRRSTKPVSVYAVLLAAVSEAEHYRQIAIVPVEDVEIHGHAVAEIIHLLAELLENATRFTSPDGPKVEVRAVKVTAGLAIEVQDRGLGMPYEDLERINHLLDGSTRIDLSELLSDGRIGLAVVRELARRHDIKVRLQSNIFGGIAAAVVIPPQLLSEPERESRHRAQQQQRPSALPKRRTEPTMVDAAAPELSGRISEAAATHAHALAPASGPQTHAPAKTSDSQGHALTQASDPQGHALAPASGQRGHVLTSDSQGHVHVPTSEPQAHVPASASGPQGHAHPLDSQGHVLAPVSEPQAYVPAPASGPQGHALPLDSQGHVLAPVSEPQSHVFASVSDSQVRALAHVSDSQGPVLTSGSDSPAHGVAPVSSPQGHVFAPGSELSGGRLAARTRESGAGSASEPIADQHSGQLVPPPSPRASTSTTAQGSHPTPAEQSGPIQVPAPLPIPTASVSSRGAGFGGQSGRRRRAEPEDELPVLPVRAPGRSYDDLRAGGDGGIAVDEQDDEPPPLPQRRGTHLRDELLEPPAVTKPVPGHNTSLMKTFQAGRDNWHAEQNRDATNRGDSWPTT